jgi:hypothetical protein
MNEAGEARFELGYTLVCNRSQSDLGITNDERNAREAIFFKREPWSAIPEERAGAKSLKGRLNNLLVEVTRHNFQAVAEDVRLRIHNLEGELNDMGPGRHTPNDQRNHLIRIATDVREITSRAVDAYYGRDPCFEDNTFRLATNVMTMNKSFSDAIAQKGCTRRFRTQSSENDTTAALEPRVAGHETFASSTDSLDTPITPKSGTENQLLREYPELKVLMGPPVPAPAKPKQDIMQWITKQ